MKFEVEKRSWPSFADKGDFEVHIDEPGFDLAIGIVVVQPGVCVRARVGVGVFVFVLVCLLCVREMEVCVDVDVYVTRAGGLYVCLLVAQRGVRAGCVCLSDVCKRDSRHVWV